MKVVDHQEIDGHDVVVVADNEGDDSTFYELIVDGTPLTMERFNSPPGIEAMRAAVAAELPRPE